VVGELDENIGPFQFSVNRVSVVHMNRPTAVFLLLLAQPWLPHAFASGDALVADLHSNPPAPVLAAPDGKFFVVGDPLVLLWHESYEATAGCYAAMDALLTGRM